MQSRLVEVVVLIVSRIELHQVEQSPLAVSFACICMRAASKEVE
jgi:hypothetical protein